VISLRAALAAAAVAVLSLPAAAQTFVFDLRGTQEVPPVASTASGGCFGQLDQPAKTFSVTCVHNVLNATVMHIHHGAPGTNGTVAFDLGSPAANPVTGTWTSMSDADVNDLLMGNLYVNIHSAGRPSGEIRGQILPRTVDLVEFTADGWQVVPPNESAATASCTADLDGPATSLAIQCTHTEAGATAAHVHQAPAGSNGPVVFTFPSAASPLNGNMPMTPVLVADFAATFLYLDIHTPASSESDVSDEIRGQIGTPPAPPNSGTIVISKQTNPAGGTGFGFTETMTSGSFTLADGASQTFNAVPAGTYTVTENDPSGAGYALAALTCDDADSTTDTNSRTATIRLTAGETVRCTFRNFAAAPTDQLFVFHMSGDQEVPPVTTAERGGCMGRFNAGTSTLSLLCVHNVSLPTIMHVHRGAAGTAGPVAFDLSNPTSPVIATWSGMTPADVADLLAGNLYVNIHTSGRPGGDIRGQILPRTVDAIAFTADASQVVPPGTSPSMATCNADLDAAATSLALSCTHNVVSPTSARVHQAPRGVNGPIAFTFPSPVSPMNASMPMTPRLVADFAAYFLYLEIDGPTGGEDTSHDDIRGQIAPPLVVPTTGTIHIRKVTSPAGGAGFQFTETMTPGSFTLADGGDRVFTNVPAGTYTVTENALAGWSLTDVVCGDGDSTGNVAARNATIHLQAGESVTCTFTNLQSVASPTNFVFRLSADQEVPPHGSAFRGGCYGQLDAATGRFEIVCVHNVIGATMAHIHSGAPGVNGPVVFDLPTTISPIDATWMMTPAQVTELVAGHYYLNIHTSGRPNGEIRGDIVPRGVDRFSFAANAAQEVPPTDSPATGDCLADLSDDATNVFVQCTHNVPSPTDIHLHSAPPGVDGPVLFHFPIASPFSGTVPLAPRFVADFAAGFLYVNLHSPNYEEGEIRGQLIGPAVAPPPAVVPTTSEWGAMVLLLALAAIALVRMR
jgi:hypothetical protein